MQMVYQGLNIVAQVLGVLVSLLCGVFFVCLVRIRHDRLLFDAGCIYVHNVAACIMDKVFPPICVFPYNVYSKIFTGSGGCFGNRYVGAWLCCSFAVQVWEGIKASTNMCMIHGDFRISS